MFTQSLDNVTLTELSLDMGDLQAIDVRSSLDVSWCLPDWRSSRVNIAGWTL